MPEFIAYIDEAGDEGFGKLARVGGGGGQSRWLLMGACIVPANEDAKVPAWRNAILKRLNAQSRDLHFHKLPHDQRVVVCQEIAKLPVETAVIFSHKITIPNSPFEKTFKRKGYLYNYLVRWLLERVTTHVAAAPGQHNKLSVVFSKRRATDYASMREYMILMRDGRELIRPVRSIKWDVFDVGDIEVEDHANRAGLQLADCMTSAFYCAVEPNRFGNCEPAYAELLRDKVIRLKGNALNHGIAPVPSWTKCRPEPHHKDFFFSFTK